MDKKKNNGILILMVGVIIIALVVLCILFATNTISIKSDKLNPDEEQSNNNEVSISINYDEEVEKLSNWVFNYIHSLSVYCGDNMKWNNEEDYIPHQNANYIHLYDVSQDFKTVSELNNYVKNYISDEMVSSYSRSGYSYDTYKEKDGKLYCLNSNKDNGVLFDKDKTTYKIIESNEKEINVVGNVAYYETGNEYPTYDVTPIKIIKSGDNWIISSYVNIYTGMINIRSVDQYLNKIIMNNTLNSNHQITIGYSNKIYSSSDEIKSVANIIEGVYISPNGEKWIEPHLEYDQKGYVTQITF